MLRRDESPAPRLIGEGVYPGSDEVRSRYLMDVFNQVNSIVKKKEKRKRRLLREARRLQKETDDQISLMREIEKIEAEYEGQIRERVRELREKIEQEKRNSQIIVSEEEEEDGSEERRSIKNMKRIESAEKVVSNDIDFSKITRKKFVNNKYKVEKSPNNQRVTLDLITSQTVG